MSDTNTLEPGVCKLGLEQTDADAAGSSVSEHVARLYTSHRLRIYHFVVAQGVDSGTAQEIAQDVFVRLFVAITKGTKVVSESAWLYSVASKLAADYWRREGRSMWMALDSVRELIDQLPSAQASPESNVVSNQRLRRVAAETARLPKEQRETLHLRMQGLRYREIAKTLGVSVSTVADWLSATVDRLRGVADE
jgi:RNA polymerase sigma-70 factor (ECF subfamily)